MVALGECVIEVIFYGFRTLTHSKNIGILDMFITLILLFLVIFDLIEIWHLTASFNSVKKSISLKDKKKLNTIYPKQDESNFNPLKIVKRTEEKEAIQDEALEDWSSEEFIKK
jgi:anionic cell wall polymer biosynthesis LytR-Cps2A-Psr (LCP) family protein